jgi:hypothetical protein
MLEVPWGEERRLHFVATQDDGEGLRFLGVRDILDHPGAVQGRLVEKAEGTDRLNECAPGCLLLRNEELLEQIPENLSRKSCAPIIEELREVMWSAYIFVVFYSGDHPHADPQTALSR